MSFSTSSFRLPGTSRRTSSLLNPDVAPSFNLIIPENPVVSHHSLTTANHDASSSTRPSARKNSIRGSYKWDSQHNYTLKWSSEEEFRLWHQREQRRKCIELLHHGTRLARGDTTQLWEKKVIYVCSRGPAGGRKESYEKKKDRERKVSRKFVECGCRLTIKTYPGVSDILGYYVSQHNHDTGEGNACYTRIPKETRHDIETLLRAGMKPNAVLDEINSRSFHVRNEFVCRADIQRIGRVIEEENIRLGKKDGESLLHWVERLREMGALLGFKAANQPPPAGSGLDRDAFVLIIQNRYMQKCWEEWGKPFAGLDATHNTTHYEGMSLFTLICRDKFGHGMPAAFMISSNATEETVSFFLKQVHDRNPKIDPENFMSDFNWPQLNAIQRNFPNTRVFLCRWHVLHAWQAHFHPTHYPELWGLLKAWTLMSKQDEFDEAWRKIKSGPPDFVPPSFISYLETYWMIPRVVKWWSYVHRQNRSIFQTSDTNMLVEAWHHLLKSGFLEGKRNRRADHLIYTLVHKAIPYFEKRHRRQKANFEGLDLEARKRSQIEESAQFISRDNITPKPLIDSNARCTEYLVKSQSDTDVQYLIDIDVCECECLDFPLIRHCKHLAAVRNHFVDTCSLTPISVLFEASDITETDSDSESEGENSEDDVAASPHSLPHARKSELTRTVRNLLNTVNLRLNNEPDLISYGKLEELQEQLQDVMDELDSGANTEKVLPQKKHVAPATGTGWRETAEVMGSQPKSKKRKEWPGDAYAGGEGAAKKAKPDARGPPPPTSAKPPLPAPNLSTPPAQLQGIPFPTAAPPPCLPPSNISHGPFPGSPYSPAHTAALQGPPMLSFPPFPSAAPQFAMAGSNLIPGQYIGSVQLTTQCTPSNIPTLKDPQAEEKIWGDSAYLLHRHDVQFLAKKWGVRANAKTADIINEIRVKKQNMI